MEDKTHYHFQDTELIENAIPEMNSTCGCERLWECAGCVLSHWGNLHLFLTWGGPVLAFAGIATFHYYTGFSLPDKDQDPEKLRFGVDAAVYMETCGVLRNPRDRVRWQLASVLVLFLQIYSAYRILREIALLVVRLFGLRIPNEHWFLQMVQP